MSLKHCRHPASSIDIWAAEANPARPLEKKQETSFQEAVGWGVDLDGAI